MVRPARSGILPPLIDRRVTAEQKFFAEEKTKPLIPPSVSGPNAITFKPKDVIGAPSGGPSVPAAQGQSPYLRRKRSLVEHAWPEVTPRVSKIGASHTIEVTSARLQELGMIKSYLAGNVSKIGQHTTKSLRNAEDSEKEGSQPADAHNHETLRQNHLH